LLFPSLNRQLGQNTFLPFAVVLVFAILLVMCVVPETKGKSLEEIQRELTGSVEDGDDFSQSSSFHRHSEASEGHDIHREAEQYFSYQAEELR